MERLTRGEAIKAKCLDCCCGQYIEVKKCTVTTCPLWIYRLGSEVASDGSSLPKKRTRSPKKQENLT
jgi:hypothetical protein